MNMKPEPSVESPKAEPSDFDELRSVIAELEDKLETLELEASHRARDVLELVIHSLHEIIIAESED